ncbi:MAG: hypothetical protein HC890_18250 [Chloroflexaceae bacterium]|nr:hypothetical protein [Chloroflexaceae bacterium]
MAFSENIDSFLNRARVAIDGALINETILGYLSEFGYPRDRLQQGKALYETALAAQQRRQAEYGEQIAATAALAQVRETAAANYMRFLKIARVACKNDPGATTALGLDGTRRKSLSGWLAQVKQFYANALSSSEILAALAQFGVTPEKLRAAQGQLASVEAASLAQDQETGEAQNATQFRDRVLDELADWLEDYLRSPKLPWKKRPN